MIVSRSLPMQAITFGAQVESSAVHDRRRLFESLVPSAGVSAIQSPLSSSSSRQQKYPLVDHGGVSRRFSTVPDSRRRGNVRYAEWPSDEPSQNREGFPLSAPLLGRREEEKRRRVRDAVQPIVGGVHNPSASVRAAARSLSVWPAVVRRSSATPHRQRHSARVPPSTRPRSYGRSRRRRPLTALRHLFIERRDARQDT